LEVTLADLARWRDGSVDDVLLAMRGRFPQIIDKERREEETA
jgi:hypothetical protein